MSQSDRIAPAGGTSRNMAVAGAVVVAHAAALWAMQHGLAQQHPPEVVIPATVIAQFVTPPAPEQRAAAPAPLDADQIRSQERTRISEINRLVQRHGLTAN